MHFPSPRQIIQLLHGSLRALQYNDPLRLAAATAFFTTFALPAILIILLQLFGLVFNPDSISDHLFEHLAEVVGDDSVDQIRNTLEGFQKLASNWFVTIAGFVFLVFVSTTLFKIIRDSLNQLWNIKPKEGIKWNVTLVGRLKSVAVIVLSGVLFLAVLLGEGIQSLLREYINELWPGSGSLLFPILNQVIAVIIVTIWFSVLFKFLPDGNPCWRVTVVGALFTGILFTIGKLVLGGLLRFSNISNVYGASGSLVLLLLFVFYSSFILYYGAMFTYVWAEYRQLPIEPRKNAYKYELVEVKKEEEKNEADTASPSENITN